MKTYNFKEVESSRQAFWEARATFGAKSGTEKPKYYCLVMFPYPSGELHVGHGRNYILGDSLMRWKVKEGYNVMFPIGWDAYTIWQFSENYYFPGCISAADGDWFNGDLGQARAWFGNHRQVDPPFYSHTRLRSLFNGLHVRRSPDVKSREVDHLNKGDQVELENLGGKDVWVRHSKGWSCIEKDDYRYMEIVKDE